MTKFNSKKRPESVGVRARTGEIGKALSDPFSYVMFSLNDVCRVLNVKSKYDLFPPTEDNFELTEFERSLHYFACEDGKEETFVDLRGLWTLAVAGEVKEEEKLRCSDFLIWAFRVVASELFRKEAHKFEDVAIMFSHSLSLLATKPEDAMRRVGRGIGQLASLLKDEDDNWTINEQENGEQKI